MRRILHEASAFMVNECLMANSRRQARQRRLFRCATGIVGGHHAGAPTNAQNRSSRISNSGPPLVTIGGEGGAFPLPKPAQPETLTATRVATKANSTFFIGVPLSSRQEALCLATLFVAPLAL